MSDYEDCWPEQEAEERRRTMPDAAHTDHTTTKDNSNCGPYPTLRAYDSTQDRGVCKAQRARSSRNNRSQNTGVAPRSTAQHLLTPEALQQEAEALQRAEDEEHQRITNIRVVGFMIKRAQDGVEETAVPASSLAAQPGVTDIADSRDSSVSNGVAQANQIVATVNIELAGEVVRLEAEIAQLHERCAILQTNNKALESRITAMAPQKERTNTIDFMSTGTNEQVDKDECECAEKEQ